VLSPELFNVCADSAADRSEVVETSCSTVDFEALEEDKAALDEIV